MTPTYAAKLASQELSAAISWSSRIPRLPDNSASPIIKWMGYSLAPIGTMITHSGNGNVSSQIMPDQLKNHLLKLSSHTTPTTRTRPWSGSFGLLTFPKSSGSLDGQSLFHWVWATRPGCTFSPCGNSSRHSLARVTLAAGLLVHSSATG